MSRQGQVTIFVILGIVLLLVAVLFITLRNNPDVGPDELHDFSAVKASYESAASACLTIGAADAFQQVFIHGGYADPEAMGLIGFKEFPTTGSALLLSDDHLVPYWLRQDSGAGCEGGCRFSMAIPPLNEGDGASISIGEQVGDLMEESVPYCLDRWQASADYEVSMSPDLSVSVAIGDGGVYYELEREVEVTFAPSGAKTTITKASAKTDDKVKEFYDNTIAALNQGVLEDKIDTLPNAVLTIVEAYGMGADPVLPPLAGGMRFTESNGRPMTWMLPEVQDELQLVLADNLPLVQVPGTAAQSIFLDPNQYSDTIYNAAGVFRPTMTFPYPDVASNMSFLYVYDPSWPVDLQINGGDFYLRPEGFATPRIIIIPSIGFYDYTFTYDLVVPVLVVVEDDMMFDGEGLTLMYALESGLTGSEPSLYGAVPQTAPADDEVFSENDYLMDGLVSVTVVDALSNDPMVDAEVFYGCGDLLFEAGVTDHDGFLEAYFPFCLGGNLYAEMDGYYSEVVAFSNVDDEDAVIGVEMYPLHEFSLRVEPYSLTKVHSFDDITNDDGFLEEYQSTADNLLARGIDPSAGIWDVNTASPGSLLPDQVLTVIFTRDLLPGEQEHVQVAMFNHTAAFDQTVSLAVGTYTVEAYLVLNLGPGMFIEEIVIPEDEVCWGDEFLDFQKKECETVDEIRFNESFYGGGITFENNNALTITIDDYAKETLTIPYLSISTDGLEKHADLGVLGNLDGYKRVYAADLQPSFS